MNEINILHIGTPIILLTISLLTYIFVSVEIKKRRLEFKDIVTWFVMNTIYTICIIYVLIIEILQVAWNKPVFNLFSWLAYYALGISFDGQEWIAIVIFAFITFILIQVMVTTVRVQRLKKNVNDLNKEVAILSGKVNKTADLKIRRIPTSQQKSLADVKSELREKIKIARVEKRAQNKLNLINHKVTKMVKKSATKKKN